MSQNGKGDLLRPTDWDAYERQYEQLDWNNHNRGHPPNDGREAPAPRKPERRVRR